MNIKFASRVAKLVDPSVANALKQTGRPGVISLSGGIPHPALFPIAEIQSIVSKIINMEGQKVLQYSQTAGLLDLRNEIATYYSKKWQRKIKSGQVLITTGSQQALDLLGKALLDKNDTILVEDPTYFVALSAFNGYEVKYKTVQLNEYGIDIKHLQKQLTEGEEKIKFAYVIPTFQNPTGRTWSTENRKEVLALAKKHKLLIIEDDPYSELYFGSKPPPSLMSLDNSRQIIYLGTFSKTFCPGLRVGYIIASSFIIEKLTLIKQGMDLHTATLSQALVFNYIKQSEVYKKHLKTIRDYYRDNSSFMLYCLDKHLLGKASWTHPTGGLFIWVTIPRENCQKLYQKTIEKGMSFMPGYPFYAKKAQSNTLRLTFATANKNEIEMGIKILSTIIK